MNRFIIAQDRLTLSGKSILEQSIDEIKKIINGKTVVVGHQYTLIVPNIVENTKQDGKNYLEWSGTLRIEIDEEKIGEVRGTMQEVRSLDFYYDEAQTEKVESVRFSQNELCRNAYSGTAE